MSTVQVSLALERWAEQSVKKGSRVGLEAFAHPAAQGFLQRGGVFGGVDIAKALEGQRCAAPHVFPEHFLGRVPDHVQPNGSLLLVFLPGLLEQVRRRFAGGLHQVQVPLAEVEG